MYVIFMSSRSTTLRFGILFADAVLDHRNELAFGDEGSDLSKFFGGLYPSVVTLFRSISNGLTWGEAADALEALDNGIFWSSLFHFYVAFCSFAVLNVMTGGVGGLDFHHAKKGTYSDFQ